MVSFVFVVVLFFENVGPVSIEQRFFLLNRNWISGTEFYRVSTRFDRLLLGAVLGFTGCLPSCTGFLIDLLGQKKSSPPYLFLSSRGLLGFYSMLPDGFTIFTWLYWVLLSFTEFLLSFTGFYLVLLGFT